MSDSSFYNTWRNNWVIERERGRGNIRVTVASTTHGEITGIERREGGKHE